jgi:hypothetical protein
VKFTLPTRWFPLGGLAAPDRRIKSGKALFGLIVIAAIAFLAGCGANPVAANPSNSVFSIAPATAAIDTNCAGCNSANSQGSPVLQFAATQTNGAAADVVWSVSGGDLTAGAGAITAKGQYLPPSYLSADRVQIFVTATLKSNPSLRATSALTLTPGFLQPLTPENLALGAGGATTVTGVLAEVGGAAGIHFSLSDSPNGASVGQGELSVPTCQRTRRAFTSCSVTYTAPATVQGTAVTYVVATAAGTSHVEAAVLLNASGVASNPATHQSQLATPMLLGTSGGNNADFDTRGNTIVDCCSGTLGALLQDNNGRQYLLSNNHVLARSDHAGVGDAIVQPGLIDNNCTPNGDGAGTLPVGALTAWLPLKASQTNADAAIAEVAAHTVDPTGSILELGARLPDGTLTAAPPGTSSTAGKGESAGLQLRIAKSGRTTGLTCGGVSAIAVDVSIDYFRDCAETRPYFTRTFTNQIGLSGNAFSDSGDSGALVVDAANAEPVGLYFAGGLDTAGVSQGMANPAGEVLSELSSQSGGSNSYSFVGGADHPVSCLSYGNNTVTAAQSLPLTDAEIARVQLALPSARSYINPQTGILGVAMGKSSDHPGEAAIIVYVDSEKAASVPATISGVRTLVIPADARSVLLGSALTANAIASAPPLGEEALNAALTVKRQVARSLMQQNRAFFGIGVGQSLDNPKEAALVFYVDRSRVPADLPQSIDGLRTRYIVMSRLHVTRSFSAPFQPRLHCTPHASPAQLPAFDPTTALDRHTLEIF